MEKKSPLNPIGFSPSLAQQMLSWGLRGSVNTAPPLPFKA